MLDQILQSKNKLILVFTIAYLTAFTFNGILNANFEFLYYTFLISFFIYIVVVIHQRLLLAFFILFNMSVLGFLHLLGGHYHLDTLRLYDLYFIPGVFRYDNFVHAYASFIGTLALYSLFINFTHESIKKRFYLFALIIVLMSMGVGTVVEMAEFSAVVVFEATQQVGGYYNNALDLVFNSLGAMLAMVVIYFYRNPPWFIRKLNVKA